MDELAYVDPRFERFTIINAEPPYITILTDQPTKVK